ncbi:hypothetical protein MMC21_002067 [Puttea exsequens]|nr:hypothetical protein [Puttea exsequens]
MDEPLLQSPYKTLNVPKDATLATIRSAHRKLVLSCHPDKVQDPAEKLVKAEQFHQVQQAYEVLSDDKRRQRYDEKVKLEELRAEMQEERRPMRRTNTDYIPRPAPPPRYETYNGQVYETASPKYTRGHEDDFFTASFAERPSVRKFDERYSTGPSRKTSGRGPEDRKKSRDYADEEFDRKAREKEDKAHRMSERERKDRKRDKDRRRDSEAKMRSKHAFVGDDSESDSDLDDVYYKSRISDTMGGRYEQARRGSREEPPRKSKRDARDYDDELEQKEKLVYDYISKARDPVEIEPVHRPMRTRTNSNAAVMTPPQPAPVESGKRSLGRGGRGRGSRNPSPVRSSKKDKRAPEIVEPPPRIKPNLPKASTESRGLKGLFTPSSSSSRRPPHRAATYQSKNDNEQHEFKAPPIRRSETTPMEQTRRRDTRPLHTSNLKNMKAPSDFESSNSSDTDSDSMQTDEIPTRPRQQQKTSYRVHHDEDKFVLEPEVITPRRSDESTRNRFPPERPGISPRVSQARTPPILQRASTQAFPAEERSPRTNPSRRDAGRTPPPPPLTKHQSARNSPRLYGEYSSNEETFKTKSKKSPKIYDDYDDGRNAKYSSRRGSAEPTRDAWAGTFKSRPHTTRHETAAY